VRSGGAGLVASFAIHVRDYGDICAGV